MPLGCQAFRAVLIAVSAIASTAVGEAPITLTMGDYLPQSVDGFVHPAGVTFGFSIDGAPSTDAQYASGGPGQTSSYVSDPSIEGPAVGTLSVVFERPVSALEFGVAVFAGEPLPGGLNITLHDDMGIVLWQSGVDLHTPAGDSVPGAKFEYSGAPIASIMADFSPSAGVGGAERFAFDNLTFLFVPEPSAWLFATLGCYGIASRRR